MYMQIAVVLLEVVVCVSSCAFFLLFRVSLRKESVVNVLANKNFYLADFRGRRVLSEYTELSAFLQCTRNNIPPCRMLHRLAAFRLSGESRTTATPAAQVFHSCAAFELKQTAPNPLRHRVHLHNTTATNQPAPPRRMRDAALFMCNAFCGRSA